MKTLIKNLVETPGPSGHERLVRELVQIEIETHVESYYVDALGNLIARKGAQDDKGLKIMVAAHMDEIGLIISHVDENGFARFTSIGGVYPINCIGGRVRFLDGTQGVINAEHQSDTSRVPPLEAMYIDTGATSRADSSVKVGDVAAFERPFLDLGSRLISKAMDDRIGVAIVVETIRNLKDTPHQLFFVFSVQEEVGLRGATTAAYRINPDIGLAVDVTRTGDTPKGIKMEVALGKGPAIKVRDGGMLSDPRVVDWMVTTASRTHTPYQMEVLISGTTDARAMQISRAGVPSGCLSIPCRYIHAPSEMVDFQDVENAVQLLLALLSTPFNLL